MAILDRHLEINSKHFITIINHLKLYGGNARLIGGVVRDSLLGILSSDIDIATDLTPGEVTNILTKYGIKVIPTGIKFGTVTAIIKGESFEITTLRKDVDCDGRHTKVEYSNDFAEDAARRDFTINALSYCPIEQKIYDYFGGIKDLEEKRVRFIGNAADRVQEDYLRILRFFRFSAKYAKEIDPVGLDACVKFKADLKKLSKERIKSEMDILLSNINAPKMLFIMSDTGILSEILPVNEYSLEFHMHALEVCKQFRIKPSLSFIYSILFIKNFESVNFSGLISLKFSKYEASIIMKMLDLVKHKADQNLEYILKNIWLEEKDFEVYFAFLFLLAENNKLIYNLYSELARRKVPTFPVKGNDILMLGYQGKKVGRILDYLKQQWIRSNFAYKKAYLLDMIKENEK